VLVVTVIIALVVRGVESMQLPLQCNHQLSAKGISKLPCIFDVLPSDTYFGGSCYHASAGQDLVMMLSR